MFKYADPLVNVKRKKPDSYLNYKINVGKGDPWKADNNIEIALFWVLLMV